MLDGGQLGSLAALAGGFSRLEPDQQLIGQFVPIVLNFVRERGGVELMQKLQQVLV